MSRQAAKSIAQHVAPGDALKIVATSQTSRFHVDTVTTLSQEIDLKQVNISIGGNEDLFVDAHLRLKTGVRYGLVGRNGQGKSTLLRAIAHKIIPGIPDNLRILLVDQVDESWLGIDSQEDLQRLGDLTVTERVVKTDLRRERAMTEHRLLTQALESANPSDLACAVASILLSRSKAELETAQKIALRRSGTRGSEARKSLLKAEATVRELEESFRLVEQGHIQGEPALQANDLLNDIQLTLDYIDASATEAHARSILSGLGFTKDQLDSKFVTLSGGWRSRCSLASALLQKPDILILDEPVNFLDLRSVIWLQDYLLSFPSTTLLVAHDKDFIDAVVQEVIILRNRTLTYFDGNLTDYEIKTREKRRAFMKMKINLDKKKEAVERSIEEGARMAKKTGDENRARMVKSRQKKLDERWGLEKNEHGHRFKLNRDMGPYGLTRREAIEIEEVDPPIHLPFPDPDPMRFPGALISASGVSFQYKASAPYILEGVNFTIHPGARIGLVGRNGHGKSTLVRLLTGSLKPTQGIIERHSRLRVGYFDQHSVEALSEVGLKVSALEYFMNGLKDQSPSIQIDEGTARSFLGSFGLQGRKATIPIKNLSGGQKVRLALALIVYPSPDLFILDEVSTHLDLDTINGLIRALRQYAGALLLVSHDRHLMRCVVEGAPIYPSGSDEHPDLQESESDTDEDEAHIKRNGVVFMVGPKGKIKELANGTDEYVKIVRKRKK